MHSQFCKITNGRSFHKAKRILHQSFEAPTALEGDEEERIKTFRKVRGEIKEYINKLPSLLTN